MNKGLLSILSILICFSAFPQASFEWVNECGNPQYGETKTRLATDNEGNVIMAGNFIDTAFFGAESIIAEGATDIFLAKHDAAGNLLWLLRDGGEDYDYLHAITSTDDGFYTAGSFYGTTDIGGHDFTSLGSQDIFIARYEADGNCLWTNHIGSPKTDYINAVDSDPFGNLIITGHYYDSIAIADTMLYATAGSDIFVAKFNATGALDWVQNFGGSSSDQSYSISCNEEGHIIFTGSFFYDIQVGDTLLTTTDPTGVFFARLDEEGETVYAIQADGTALSAPSYVSFDGMGNIYFAGNFSEVIKFGPYSFDAGAFNVDIFISRFTGDGNLLWADHGYSPGSDQVITIAEGPLNDIYLSGHFLDTIHFGDLTLDYTLCCGSAEIFIVRYTPDGIPAWGDQVSGAVAMVESMVKNEDDELFISGMFRDSLTFGGIVLNTGLVHKNFLTGIDTETITFIPEQNTEAVARVYPNPAGNKLNIEVDNYDQIYLLRLYTLQGRLVKQQSLQGRNNVLGLTSIAPGSYLLTLFSDSGVKLASQVIIKE